MGIYHVLHHCQYLARHLAIGTDNKQVMESFDMFLNGNFVALDPFQRRYGVPLNDGTGKYAIPTKWQSALFQSGQCGAFVGVFAAGPVTNRIGYRWTTILALVLMNATIFISFFADSLSVLTVGQALEGVPWGFFIANSPAYASEVVPLVLRAATTATLQMSWSIGGIIVAAATYGYNKRNDEWAWRVPLALQWIFPVSPRHPMKCMMLIISAATHGPGLPGARITMVARPQGPKRAGTEKS